MLSELGSNRPPEDTSLMAEVAWKTPHTYSLHCSSFFWFNQLHIKDPKRQPQKGTTMETIGRGRMRAFSTEGLLKTLFGVANGTFRKLGCLILGVLIIIIIIIMIIMIIRILLSRVLN